MNELPIYIICIAVEILKGCKRQIITMVVMVFIALLVQYLKYRFKINNIWSIMADIMLY